jgi:large subunit ribosomal protein L21
VLQHLKEIKLSFSKEKKKRIQKRNGHRQYLTQIVIEGITGLGAKRTVKKAAVEVNHRRRGSKKKVAKAKKEDTQE